jgi:hypothetical protein
MWTVDAQTSPIWGTRPYKEADVSPSAPPSSGGPQAAATAGPWLLASAVASLIFGILSLLLIGLFFFWVFVAGRLPVWVYEGPLLVWVYAASVACGVIGAVLGHLARAHPPAPRSRHAALTVAGLVLSYGGTLLSVGFYVLVYLAFQVFGSDTLMN